MGLTTVWNKEPEFAPKDYITRYTEPTPERVGLQDWLFTPEMEASEHPWSDRIDPMLFPDPDLTYKIIAMQHATHPVTGDVYWDIEAYCPEKNAFVTVSYSENA